MAPAPRAGRTRYWTPSASSRTPAASGAAATAWTCPVFALPAGESASTAACDHLNWPGLAAGTPARWHVGRRVACCWPPAGRASWLPAQSAAASPMASTAVTRSDSGPDSHARRPDGPVIDAEMVDRAPWNRPVGRPGSQGACDEFLPEADVAARGGINHAALHSAVPVDSGHDDLHQPSLSPAAASAGRQGRWRPAGVPGRFHASLVAASMTAPG